MISSSSSDTAASTKSWEQSGVNSIQVLQSLLVGRALTYLRWKDLYLYNMKKKNTEQIKHQEFKVLYMYSSYSDVLKSFGHHLETTIVFPVSK